MSFKRGRFGVEFNELRRDRSESHLLRWTLIGAAVLAIASFVTARGCVRRVRMPDFTPPSADPVQPAPSKIPSSPQATPVATATPDAKPKPAPKPEPTKKSVPSAAAQMVERWLATSAGRPARERTLLEKLLAADRASNAVLALDTIERLRQRPAMADLDEPLARRLGALNLQLLLSDRPTSWTTVVTSRRGDTPFRIAREHGTTVSAVQRLNGLAQNAKLEPGTRLRVLEFPRAAIVIHRQTKQADLTINGKFFKRYYASTSAATKVVSVQVTREAGPRTRFAELGIVFAPGDLDELAMFLPPGASIAVTNP